MLTKAPTFQQHHRQAQLAPAFAASSSSSSSSAAPVDDDGDDYKMSAVPTRTEMRPARLEPFQRTAKPSDPGWPHLNFLESKARWAFDTKCDKTWLENNSDFGYCQKHNELCEMMPYHEKQMYNMECDKCLRPNRMKEGNVPTAGFFHKEHVTGIATIADAEKFWLQYWNVQEGTLRETDAIIRDKESTPVAINEAKNRQKQFNFLERSAFLWYNFLAWDKTQYRMQAIKENAQSPGNSSKFNMLAPGADESLVKFNRNALLRHRRTAAGRSGQISINQYPCPEHEPSLGHAVHGYNKERYKGCGICIKEREISLTQKILNSYDASAERPVIPFAKPTEQASSSSSTGKWRSPSLAKPRVAMHRVMSLADEEQMN